MDDFRQRLEDGLQDLRDRLWRETDPKEAEIWLLCIEGLEEMRTTEGDGGGNEERERTDSE